MAKDPTRDEMLAFIRELGDDGWWKDAEPDVEEALYWFAADHHGGQWSNLYKALCASPYKPSLIASAPGSAADYYYEQLRRRYSPLPRRRPKRAKDG